MTIDYAAERRARAALPAPTLTSPPLPLYLAAVKKTGVVVKLDERAFDPEKFEWLGAHPPATFITQQSAEE